MPSIYEPSEDSFLMSEILKEKLPILLRKNPELKFLEIGAGSGINLAAARDVGVKDIVGSDINVNAVNHCKGLGFKVILSNLFSNIKRKFDVIAFNPPYLPLDKREPKDSGLETTGGKRGNEIIIKFLKQARNHLTENGKIFLLISSLTPEINFKDLGYKSEVISKKDLFFEKLFVWECLKI